MPEADDLGILMALENHGGISANVWDLIDIIRAIGSPNLGICADFGNFPASTRKTQHYTMTLSSGRKGKMVPFMGITFLMERDW